MPANPDRRFQLRQHLIRSTRRPATWIKTLQEEAEEEQELAEARRRHAGVPGCPVCGWPLTPAAGTVHPGCEEIL